MYLLNRTLSIVIAIGLLSTLAGISSAQIREWKQEDKLTIVKMTITPADEPIPALKHQLVLRPNQMRNGNAVTHYLRSYPEGGFERTYDRLRERYGEEIYDWHSPGECALSDLPKEAFPMAGYFKDMTDRFYEPASRCKEADWGHDLSELEGTEVYSFLLPELQSARSISRMLALRTRIATVERRFDDAINLMRMNYKLGHDINQSSFLVSSLIGMGVQGITDQSLVEFIAQPDAPSLYWALAEMPSPLISVRESLRLEMQLAKQVFPLLDSPADKSFTHAEWNARWNQLFSNLPELKSVVEVGDTSVANAYQVAAKDFIGVATGFLGYSHAKERLSQLGYSKDELEPMAVGQLLSIYSAYSYDRWANDIEKLYYVPYHQSGLANNNFDKHPGFLNDDPDREIVPVVALLLPATEAAIEAEMRHIRNHSALRVIEALRIHAAQNDGQLPANLSDITCVPVPRNPATDKPFEYRLEEDTAILELPISDGFHYGWRYEIRVAK